MGTPRGMVVAATQGLPPRARRGQNVIDVFVIGRLRCVCTETKKQMTRSRLLILSSLPTPMYSRGPAHALHPCTLYPCI